MDPAATLDIRPVPPPLKHPTIFRTFEALPPGQSFLLINDHDPKPLYYQFAAEKPGQFEWNYIEQGPEVWAVKIGKTAPCGCGHQHFQKATDALKDDHETIKRVLDALQKLMKNSHAPSLDAWAKAIDFIRNFADKCHHLKEEKILFPALEEHGMPVDGGPIGMMLFEHEEGRAYVRNMAEALELANEDANAALPRLFENAAAYSRLLRQHIEKENEILFQMADAALTPEEQKDLLRAFEEQEAQDVGPGVHEKYLAVAAELEKYAAGRAA